MQAAIEGYTAVLHASINKYCDSVLKLLKLSAMIKPLPDLSTHYDKLRDWLLSSHTWVGRKYQPKNSKFLPMMPKTMLLNYTPHACHQKCPPLLPLSPPGMLLLPQSHSIPFFPLVKLSHPWNQENSIWSLQVHHPHARSNQPALNQMTRKKTPLSAVKLSTGLEVEHITLLPHSSKWMTR